MHFVIVANNPSSYSVPLDWVGVGISELGAPTHCRISADQPERREDAGEEEAQKKQFAPRLSTTLPAPACGALRPTPAKTRPTRRRRPARRDPTAQGA